MPRRLADGLPAIRPVSAERLFPDPGDGGKSGTRNALASAGRDGLGSIIIPPAVDRGGG